jgi:hypothetical protein
VHRAAPVLTRWATSALRTAPILALSVAYLSFVFQVRAGRFWSAGIGEWLDPYFINFLLEHWHASVLSLSNPASPPMFFPIPGTLGYSHGLILYVPFYMAARAFLHPFQAYNVMLFLVIETGIICLYFVFRTFMRLSVIESLLLTTFFFTSQNIINTGTGTWSQRASVFLIPPMLLMLLASRRRASAALGALSGLLFTLLLTQEFYTGLFAAVFGALSTYDRWVAAPIAIDPACRSFFIKGASVEYMSRSKHMWSLYNVDAMFVAISRGLPTLNGYSAWTPEGWLLANPQEPGYAEAVDSWIAQHHLQAVCEFDIDRRTMTIYERSSAVALKPGLQPASP